MYSGQSVGKLTISSTLQQQQQQENLLAQQAKIDEMMRKQYEQAAKVHLILIPQYIHMPQCLHTSTCLHTSIHPLASIPQYILVLLYILIPPPHSYWLLASIDLFKTHLSTIMSIEILWKI